MPKYVIEREIPNVGSTAPKDLVEISKRSCAVLDTMGPKIQWIHSFVTNDRIYCIYYAANEELVREHANRGGFPANRISEVKAMIEPVSSEGILSHASK